MHETAQWLHPSHQRDWVKNCCGFVYHFPVSTSLGKSAPFSCVSCGCFLLSYRRQEGSSARKLCLQRFRQLRHMELNWTRPARLRKNAHSCPVYFFIFFLLLLSVEPGILYPDPSQASPGIDGMDRDGCFPHQRIIGEVSAWMPQKPLTCLPDLLVILLLASRL